MFNTMNFNLLLLILFHFIPYVYSVSRSSTLTSPSKYKNPKFDKNYIGRKSKGAIDADLDGDDEAMFDLSYSESRLRATLLENYVPEARPVINTTTVTFVDVGLTIIQVMDLDEQNQVMTTNVQVTLKWEDEHLQWSPDKYNNQNSTIFSSSEIWTPDIVLFNSADVAYSQQREHYLLTVHWNGTVEWVFPDVFRSYCDVIITYFPFDKQNCTLEIQSWSRPFDELIVRHQPPNLRQQNQYIRTEWQVYGIAVLNQTMKRYLYLVYHISMKRNYQFYVNHMIFPFTILSCLTLFVFWLPPDSGEKITLTITILLALTVFLQLISDYTPKASSSLPIIEQLFSPPCSAKTPPRRPKSHQETPNGDISRNQNHRKLNISSNPIVGSISVEIDTLTQTGVQEQSVIFNIEQILLRMQRKFDPSQINDEQLKLAILREILECQRLLLIIHAKKQDLHSQSLCDIYEEWKILAIIIDRICFIFYLISMLAASIIFFVREPILKQEG